MLNSRNFRPWIAACSLFTLAGLPGAALADDAKARAIMEKVDAVNKGDNRVSDMEMILIDRHNNQRTRSLRTFSKDFGKDTYRIMFFLSPADVENTGFLTYDYDDANKDDDQWLFLPALRKSKRIASTDKSGSFMGSDFNYADMTDRDLQNYDFTLKKEMDVDGKKVWAIEAVPRSKKIIDEFGYSKSLAFVRQDNHVVIRAINWEKDGGKMKFMEITKLEQIDGIWTPLEISMTTKQGQQTEHRTILRFHNVKYNQNLGDDAFTLRRLEKGL
ncbi:MAG: outer membrane lipoprotein-sorting protein [Gammaproteobacteria bacterium]|nr:outer membrane lipoprotein-sorting protein [Gammaproteobacteria bacterium]